MRIEHDFAERSTLPHGDATCLFPVEDLRAPVVQHRDAQHRLRNLDSREVIVVAPDSMASGYRLAQHPLTLVEIDDLSSSRRERLAETADFPIDEYSHVQFGRTIANGSNRSLGEFASRTD